METKGSLHLINLNTLNEKVRPAHALSHGVQREVVETNTEGFRVYCMRSKLIIKQTMNSLSLLVSRALPAAAALGRANRPPLHRADRNKADPAAEEHEHNGGGGRRQLGDVSRHEADRVGRLLEEADRRDPLQVAHPEHLHAQGLAHDRDAQQRVPLRDLEAQERGQDRDRRERRGHRLRLLPGGPLHPRHAGQLGELAQPREVRARPPHRPGTTRSTRTRCGRTSARCRR